MNPSFWSRRGWGAEGLQREKSAPVSVSQKCRLARGLADLGSADAAPVFAETLDSAPAVPCPAARRQAVRLRSSPYCAARKCRLAKLVDWDSVDAGRVSAESPGSAPAAAPYPSALRIEARLKADSASQCSAKSDRQARRRPVARPSRRWRGRCSLQLCFARRFHNVAHGEGQMPVTHAHVHSECVRLATSHLEGCRSNL